MTESRYIHELNAALGKLEFQERESILQDYRQHFRDGRAEGLADEAIAAALGAPQAVAAAYLEDWSPAEYPPPIPRRSRRRTVMMAAGATLVVVLLIAGLGIALSTGGGMGTAEAWIEATSVVAITVNERPMMPVAPQAPQAADLAGWLDDLMGSRSIGADELKQLKYSESFQDITRVTVEGDYQLGCTVRHSADDAIKVELSGRIPQMHDVAVVARNGHLTIVYKDNGQNVSMGNNYYPYVTLYLPAGIALDALSISTLSGVVVYDPYGASGQTTVSELTVDTMSGSITLSASLSDHFAFEALAIDTISGAVDLSYNGDFQRAAISSVSGRIEAEFNGAGQITASTISGPISLIAQPGDIQADSISGSIALRLTGVSEAGAVPVFCSSVSGHISNPLSADSADSAIRCETVSGSITVSHTP